MGHSMGSITAAWFAARYPDLPAAVILEDPAALGSVPSHSAPNSRPVDRDQMRAAILARNNRPLQEAIERCTKVSPKWGAEECAAAAVGLRLQHPNTALEKQSSRPPLRDLLPRITIPTLIVEADAQGELRKRNEEAAALLPKGTIVHINGAGHNLRRDNPQQTVSAIRNFLETAARDRLF
jgi:pimeloyl-ACP methyl ester carboxylesterase